MSEILPELVKCGGAQLKIRLVFATVWREKRVPQQWLNAEDWDVFDTLCIELEHVYVR